MKLSSFFLELKSLFALTVCSQYAYKPNGLSSQSFKSISQKNNFFCTLPSLNSEALIRLYCLTFIFHIPSGAILGAMLTLHVKEENKKNILYCWFLLQAAKPHLHQENATFNQKEIARSNEEKQRLCKRVCQRATKNYVLTSFPGVFPEPSPVRLLVEAHNFRNFFALFFQFIKVKQY